MNGRGKIKTSPSNAFREFGFRVVRLKYFILVVVALLIQIVAVALYLLNSGNIIDFELFNTSILFGATSAVIIILAVGILILIRTDKTRDKNKIKRLAYFKKSYQDIKNKYIKGISRSTKAFDAEIGDIELKLEYAMTLEELYGTFQRELSTMEVPAFLIDAHKYVLRYLSSERKFYKLFSTLADKIELETCVNQSVSAHRNYLEEVGNLERNLKIMI
jgi:hypothetical protein